MLFISPPFGNYISMNNTISIKGSYTLNPRPGLFSQILKTLRYSSEHNGWINCIGLRNPGIDYAIKNWNNILIDNEQRKMHNTVYSIAILNQEEIPILLKKIPNNMNLELNVSCPNIKKDLIVTGIEQFINPNRRWCIIKLSPKENTKNIDQYYNKGFRQFHCSNTLKTKKGGLSGETLRPYTNKLITYIREKYPDTTIIAGGGIKTIHDMENYKKNGANHYSISTIFFHPIIATQFFVDFNKN